MSNALAVATVTATLRWTLQSAVDQDLAGANVTAARPGASTNGTPARGVTIYLYQVTPNAAWRNQDLPARRADAQLAQRPRAALNLHYLLAFYGDDNELEPQRMLGTVVRTLHTWPVLTRQMIRETVTNPTLSFLAGSNLAEEVELVKFTPVSLSLEDLSKLWSFFYQIPYALSVAYQATVVLIDADETPVTPLPVRDRNIYVVPFRHPVIETVQSDAGPNQPIVAGSTLVLSGNQLKGDNTRVRIGEDFVIPASVTDKEVRLALASPPLAETTLRAGIRSVQVVQELEMGTPPVTHGGFESNLAAFPLRPVIEQIVPANARTAADGTRSADIGLTLNPPVGRAQRVALLLNRTNVPPDAPPAAYRFVAAPRSPTDPEASPTIIVPVSGILPGDYLVRVQVDGADSPLDLNAVSPTFGPKVSIV